MGTPKPVVDYLNKVFNQINGTEESKKFLNSIGGDPWLTTPEIGQARMIQDVKDWAGYARTAKIEPQG
jgi:tripartite-type tricarboxylate transporter receptor subunit TctC